MSKFVFDSWPQEAQDAYSERNEKLWRLVQAIMPGANGHLDDFIEPAWERAIRHRNEADAYRGLIKIVERFTQGEDQ